MKLLFTIWMILTTILVLSIIGLILFIPKDIYEKGENTPSSWMSIGKQLLNNIINK